MIDFFFRNIEKGCNKNGFIGGGGGEGFFFIREILVNYKFFDFWFENKIYCFFYS